MKTLGTACILATLLVGCSQQVQTGRIVKCPHCQKEIENSVSVIEVPTWKAKDYRVSHETTLCKTCGDEQVAYTVSKRCKYCGKGHSTNTEHACRRDSPRDKTITEGYCNRNCEREEKAYSAVDKASEKVGDGIGRVSRGIADGIIKHLR